VADDVDELFTVPPREFVAARTSLVKALRAAGRRDEASAVGALRRPPPSVWALNQLARQRPDEVADLLDAGAELSAAQAALATGDRRRFRAAVDRHRRLVGELTGAGTRLISDREVAAGDHRQDLAEDLRAASTSDPAREDLRHGRLTRRPAELDDSARGLFAPTPTAAPPADRSGTGPGPAEPADPGPSETTAETVAASAVRVELEQRLADARRVADEARDERDEHRRDLAELEASLDRARRRLDRADERLTQATDAVGGLEAELARLDDGHA
jgi:hypothetical protein